MHIALLNPQGNFDPQNRYWTEHPDFGGQLVYVKELALALGELGHRVDILTRRFNDPRWPGFGSQLDAYPEASNVRIVRLRCGGDAFLPKERLWPYIGTEWEPNIRAFYVAEGSFPEAATAHYADGGLAAALLQERKAIAFTFTGHSLGAQKMDKLNVDRTDIAAMEDRFRFCERIMAERVSMDHAARVITSTRQERREQYGHQAYSGAIDLHDESRFAVVPPGVNRRIFSPVAKPEDEEIRERIESALRRDIAPDRRRLPMVVASSRLDAKKNHVGLVRAFAADHHLRRLAILAIVVRGLEDPLQDYSSLGSDERAIMDQLSSLIGTAGLGGSVTAFPLNSQLELAACYRILAERHSVFALTALYEPFGLAPLEAMSCGLPAVVTRNGGPSESMQADGQKFGLLVDPEDPQDVARGLREILESAESWEHYHKAGIERVVTRFTWKRAAEDYLTVLNTIVAKGRRKTRIRIPAYFTRPEGSGIPLERLTELYFDADD